jgi:DNA-binding NtrC family response regulator
MLWPRCNTLQKTLIFNRGTPISAEDVAKASGERLLEPSAATLATEEEIRQWARRQIIGRRDDNVFEACMDRFASLLIAEALNITGGNRSRAAKLLGMSRPTLHSKIEKFSLEIETLVKKTD